MRIELVENFEHIACGDGGYWEDESYPWYGGVYLNWLNAYKGPLKFEVQHFSKENDAWEITINSVLKSAVLYRRS